MADLERFRPDDRRGIEQLYRRTLGVEASEKLRLRWDWEHRRNPHARADDGIWVAREGPTLVAACATLPVRVSLAGTETSGAWLYDPVVAAERQRQGLHEQLCRAIDRAHPVVLGARLGAASADALAHMRWADPVPVPCVVKPLSRRALRRPGWPVSINRLVSALTLPVVRIVARTRPLRESVDVVRRIDRGVTDLWTRVAPALPLAVRRDAAYLSWKFLEPPHVRYAVAVLRREDQVAGYAVYRHSREPQGKVTQIVDFLVAPDDERGLKTLLRWVDREARAEDSDKIRCHVLHAGFRRIFKRSGYFGVRPTLSLHARLHGTGAPDVTPETARGWHITAGDGDIDH